MFENLYVNAMNSLMFGPERVIRTLNILLHDSSTFPFRRFPLRAACFFDELLPPLR